MTATFCVVASERTAVLLIAVWTRSLCLQNFFRGLGVDGLTDPASLEGALGEKSHKASGDAWRLAATG